MIQVYFKKSPTGHPFYLAYSQGEHGFVTEQKALELEKAGVIDPISHELNQGIPAGDFVPSEKLDPKPIAGNDLSTEKGAQEMFGTDVEAMQAYCDKNKIKYGKSAKRPEYFWNKIAKYNRK